MMNVTSLISKMLMCGNLHSDGGLSSQWEKLVYFIRWIVIK